MSGAVGQKRRFAVKQSLIGSSSAYRPWKEWKEGEYVVGIFQGTSKDNFGNTNCIIKVVEADFLDSDAATALEGQTLTLNSCGSLNHVIEEMAVGNAYSFHYNGETTLAKGKFAGKKSHSVKIDDVDLDKVEYVNTAAVVEDDDSGL